MTSALLTCFTWGRRAMTGNGTGPVMTLMVEGSVLARNVGNDDCVLRAAATEPMARPPIRPINKTTARYPDHRRRKVEVKRYHATCNTRLTAALRRPWGAATFLAFSALSVVALGPEVCSPYHLPSRWLAVQPPSCYHHPSGLERANIVTHRRGGGPNLGPGQTWPGPCAQVLDCCCAVGA